MLAFYLRSLKVKEYQRTLVDGCHRARYKCVVYMTYKL
jgi:hypothetical protein